MKLKPWYVRLITIRDTCCFRYHVEFQLFYETFVNFGIKYSSNDPLPSSVRDFLLKILCPSDNNELFYKKECVDGRKCDKCSHFSLYDVKYPIDPNDLRLSNLSLSWKRYENVTYTLVVNSSTTSKNITLLDDDIPVKYFMENFRVQIYKYIKHCHIARWQDLQFKKSRDVFPKGKILSVVDFTKNYTFSPQKEIQSEYYHSDQVSIFVHIFYRHAKLAIDGFDSDENNHDVIKEYHFYISDDRTHDTFFFHHCFNVIYNDFLKRRVTFKEHWVWSYGCDGQFK